MTPKEKAKELFDKFFKYAGDIYLSKNDNTYHIVIACIDEMILICPFTHRGNYNDWELRFSDEQFVDYWEEVKKELELL